MYQKTKVNQVIKVVVQELRANQERLARLERRNRWLMFGMLSGWLAAIVFVLIVLSPYKTITAKQFVITGEEGNYRLIQGPSAITLLDPNLVMRARLSLGLEGSPFLSFYDGNETMRTSFGLLDRAPRISFYDEKQKCRSYMGLNDEGRLVITLFDDTGEKIETFGLYPQSWIEGIESNRSENAISDDVEEATGP